MRQKLSLITLLLLVATMAGNAYAAKPRKARSGKSHKAAKSHKSSKKHHREVAYEEPRAVVHYDNAAIADSVSGDSLVNFAETLIGTRYRSAMSDPDRGFDCSGFVSYVFKSFNFKVPRSSPEFIDVGEKVSYEDARPGDIIIFTSPTHKHRIGHVGIVVSNTGDDFKFIHSTSGKEHGVTITEMDSTYKRRFVQVVRLIKPDAVVLASN